MWAFALTRMEPVEIDYTDNAYPDAKSAAKESAFGAKPLAANKIYMGAGVFVPRANLTT